ncbi:hypothetical protein KAT63_02360, partial [Candidatus Parcubacteria bacterium]|nr:hypothetical protein [Candidatus Parcubacteria bacterium]
YYAGAGDGEVSSYIECSGSLDQACWDESHDATSGGSVGYDSTPSHSGSEGISEAADIYIIDRVFLPIDTSGLPDDANISTAVLKLYVNAQGKEAGDYSVVVQTTQASTTSLVVADFDQCGSVNSPTEGSDHVLATASQYNDWTLDATGRGWISKTGWTKLGLRGSHDVLDSPVGLDADMEYIRTSEYADTDYDPYLSVTYVGTQWTISPTATDIEYVNVSDSKNTVGTICAIYSVDSENNTGWDIVAGGSCEEGITVSGTVWTDEAKTATITDGRTVHLFVNSTDHSTTTTTTGVYSFGSITVAAGDSVIVYLDGVAEDGSVVTLALDAATAIDNLDIITAHVSLEHRAAGPISNTDLDDIDGVDAGDEDGITIATGNATFADNFELSIVSGENYTPGGTVTCDDFEAEGTGTFAPGANAVTVSGDWEFSSSGTFTTSGTVTFDGATAQTITSGGLSFNNVIFNNSSVSDPNVNYTGALSIAGNVTLNNATRIASTDNTAITISGTIDGANILTINSGSGVVTFGGIIGGATPITSLTSSGSGTVAINTTAITTRDVASNNVSFTGAVTLGAGLNITTDNTTNDGTITFSSTVDGANTLTLTNGAGAVTLGGIIGGTTPITSLSVTGAGTATINTTAITTRDVASNNIFFTGPVTLGDNLNITTDNTTNDGTITFSSTTNGTYNLTLNAGAAQVAFNNNVGATQSIGLLTKQGSGGDLLFGSSTLTCTGLTLSAGTINNAGTDSGAWTSTGDVTISSGTLKGTSTILTVGGNWDNNGTFTRGTGTVTFNASSGDKTINDNGSAFWNIKFDGTGATTSWTYTDEGTTVVTNSTELTNNVDTNGTVTFINARTGANPTVTSGILNIDWYLGAHTVSAASPYPGINTLNDDDITVSEASDALTVWKHNGADWGSPLASQTTGTDGTYKNPQPSTAGAIRIREYSKISTGTTYYKYNFKVDWQESYGQYDYFDDYGGNYLSSTLNTACTTNCDKVISGEDTTSAACTSQACRWHRTAPGTMTNPYTCSAGTGNTCINEPPNNGSWYVGMLTALSFTIDDYTIDFGTITPGADPTNNQTNTLSVTTSATNGYVINAWATAMACSDAGLCGTEEIADYGGTNSDPGTWTTGAGFGYSTNDTTLLTGTPGRFSGPKYAGFIHTEGGELVADRSGTECPCLNEENIITYRLASSNIQRPGPYQATIIYIATPQY